MNSQPSVNRPAIFGSMAYDGRYTAFVCVGEVAGSEYEYVEAASRVYGGSCRM